MCIVKMSQVEIAAFRLDRNYVYFRNAETCGPSTLRLDQQAGATQ